MKFESFENYLKQLINIKMLWTKNRY